MVEVPKVVMEVYFKDGHIERTNSYSMVSCPEVLNGNYVVTYDTSRGLYGHRCGVEASSYDTAKNEVKFTPFVDHYVYVKGTQEWMPTDDVEKAIFVIEEDSKC